MKRGSVTVFSIAVALSAMVAGTSGCASARNGLGTSSAVCFRAIPLGKDAVTAQPTRIVPNGSPATSRSGPNPVFVGVRSATQTQIDAFGKTHNYDKAELNKRNGGPIKSVCLVAFRGSFDPTSVSDLLPPVPPAGHRAYAVVVVSEPSNKLLGTFLRSKEPISFTHFAVGGA
jgi:hypothetical protein